MGMHKWFAVVLGSIGFFGSAKAGLTSIQSPPHGEANQAQILSHVYGGSFVADGNNFSNGSLKALRLDDSGADSTYAGDQYFVRAIAKFTDLDESFGYTGGPFAQSYRKLLDVGGSGFNTSGSAQNFSGKGDIVWNLSGGNSSIYSTKRSDNPNQQDAAVTYKLTGASDNLVRYVQFWENLNADHPSKKTRNDYNDLVVEITVEGSNAGAGGANTVPLPASIWTGSALMTALLLWRGRRLLRIA